MIRLYHRILMSATPTCQSNVSVSQLFQRLKGISLVFPPFNQFLQNLCIGLRSGVKKYHRPIMSPWQQFFQRFLSSRLFVNIPIYVSKTPKDGGIAQLFRLLQIGGAELALGRSVELLHFFSCNLFVDFFYPFQFLF